MTIEELIKARPFLEDAFRAYEKVLKFRKCTSHKWEAPVDEKAAIYPIRSVDLIFRCFSSVFDLPEDTLVPLKEAMKSGQIDLSRLPLNEAPAFSLPYGEDEIAPLLFLSSKPFFLRLKDRYPLDDRSWEKGMCPVCNSRPSLASINQEGGRSLYCSYCGTRGSFRRSGCPLCLTTHTQNITLLTAEGEDGFRLDACDSCGSYVKTIQARLLDDLSPDLADIVSMPLDVIAQGRGYRRLSPNPIGLMRIGC